MSRRRNVLIIQTDEQVASMLGIMGDPVVRTPNLDALARDGAVVFHNAYASNGVCVPSRVCLMTGRYPIAHGVVQNDIALNPAEDTLGAIFSRGGYDTGYYGKTHFGRNDDDMPGEGWAESFIWHRQYNGYLREHGVDVRYPEGKVRENRVRYWQIGRSVIPTEHYFENVITDKAVEFLRADRSRPFLCYVSCVAPHGPFTPPEPYDSMYDPDAMPICEPVEGELVGKPPAMLRWVEQNRKYVNERELKVYQAVIYGLITLVDDNVGRLVAALKEQGLYDDTLILFTTDHGDFCTRYGILGKSWCSIDRIIRTPLIVSVPGHRRAMRRTAALTDNVDILPTLMDYAGLTPSRKVQGVSQMPVLTGESESVKDAVFCYGTSEYSGDSQSQSVIRRGDWKLVQTTGPWVELYDLAEDPDESRNLAGDPARRDTLLELQDRLLQWHVANAGANFDVENASFWEDETCFYDENVFCGERVRKRG